MKGQTGAPTLSTDVGMTMSFQSGVENRYLESWDTFGFQNSVAANAAQNSAVQLRNPSNSNVIAVIEGAAASVDNANGNVALVVIMQTGATTTDYGGAAFSNAIDPRTQRQSACITSSTNTAFLNYPAIRSQQHLTVTVSQPFIVTPNQEVVVLPGMGVQIVNNVVNTQVRVSFRWRERQLEESERF